MRANFDVPNIESEHRQSNATIDQQSTPINYVATSPEIQSLPQSSQAVIMGISATLCQYYTKRSGWVGGRSCKGELKM